MAGLECEGEKGKKEKSEDGVGVIGATLWHTGIYLFIGHWM
jgi:hypothetical protein